MEFIHFQISPVQSYLQFVRFAIQPHGAQTQAVMSLEKIGFEGTKSILPAPATSITFFTEGDLLDSGSSISSSTVVSATKKNGSCQLSCHNDLQISRSGEDDQSMSSKCSQIEVVDGRRAPWLCIPLWVTISLIDLFVFGGTWTLIVCLYHAVGEDSSMNPFRGGDIVMPWVYGVYVVLLVTSAAVAVAVIYVRKEREIATRNVQFITQVMVCTSIALITRLLAAMVVYSRISISPGTVVFDTVSSLFIHISAAAMLMVVSAVTLRLYRWGAGVNSIRVMEK
ncbi:hypothetical protein SARC_06213 [Sphaeroforma arctica JP610]|uniref:Transmembrane protein n=1 Tax=Sphaeroforma arctica JP610 TaxID=667725 RepID=A0A0L0FXA4_9EUKA|nr:hypothetical protein SARC_06213 [Sphaeroforma arctica JP610]KNC81467.1 hypothetical protein SARC_06213 [Sphaeroforma arctica JP610]|eukprot:XP_014155369.1 hypothetical protein SARC_06213 [Sphaeroforma arctica JP610]